jgi:hypothetical protein
MECGIEADAGVVCDGDRGPYVSNALKHRHGLLAADRTRSLDRARLAAEHLALELTVGALMRNFDEAMKTFAGLEAYWRQSCDR